MAINIYSIRFDSFIDIFFIESPRLMIEWMFVSFDCCESMWVCVFLSAIDP